MTWSQMDTEYVQKIEAERDRYKVALEKIKDTTKDFHARWTALDALGIVLGEPTERSE